MTIDELFAHITKRFDILEQGQAHTNTALEAVAAGQKDLREHLVRLQAGQKVMRQTMATKADVQDIKATLVKHQRRIENLEE